MLLNDGFGLGTGTFTQLREKEEGRGRGNMFEKRVLGGARERGREVRTQDMNETEMKYWTVTCSPHILICHH